MILVGSQRGGAANLAAHLLKSENEQVTIHELRGFASDDLKGALHEAYAISRGTRCRQHLFSLSLNPPEEENVGVDVFEDAIVRIEEKLGLTGQPRAIVFHEKEARRHCHAVWSRIDADEMKAIPLPYTKFKLMEISRELYIEQGWQMPRGMMMSAERDPKNFTLAEWQQAKRAGKNPRAIKQALQECWAVSDSKVAFESALKERGFMLARGERRGFLALDEKGEPYSIPKWVGVRTKDARARLGPESESQGIDEARKTIAHEMGSAVARLQQEQDARLAAFEGDRRTRIQHMTKLHNQARTELQSQLEARQETERAERQARFHKGLRGLMDRITGARAKMQRRNELETLQAYQRDRAQKDDLIFVQMNERRALRAQYIQERQSLFTQREELKSDADFYRQLDPDIEELRAEIVRPEPNAEKDAERGLSNTEPDIDLDR
ncbi:MAG: relaxase [Pseudomonadota bacterium]